MLGSPQALARVLSCLNQVDGMKLNGVDHL